MLKRPSIRPIARLLPLGLLLVLAACGGGPTAGQPTRGTLVRETPGSVSTPPALPSAAPVPTAATTAPPATSQPGAANALITYTKSGGIAGINETLTVYADGTLELRGKRSETRAQADPADIQRLQQLLASPEFAALQSPTTPVAPDQFEYELTVPGRRQPIVTVDGANNPPVLTQLLEILEQLKARVK